MKEENELSGRDEALDEVVEFGSDWPWWSSDETEEPPVAMNCAPGERR